MDVAAKVSHVWSKETKSVERSIILYLNLILERKGVLPKHVGNNIYHKEHDKDWKNTLQS